MNSLLKKVKDIFTARPRVIKLPTGTITLSGFSKEEADRLSQQFQSAEPKVETSGENANETKIDEATLKLPFKALGFQKNKSTLHWEAVVVGYDLSTNQVEIEEVKRLSDAKPVAWSQWRRTVEELKIYDDAK